VLQAIERQHFDVLRCRPVITRGRKAWLLLETLAARVLGLGRK
jgi:hypothetical protein